MKAPVDTKHEPFKNYLPPGRFVMAAFIGFSGIGWGWWNLRNERRENLSTIVFVVGLCIWGYAVNGLIWWSFKF